MKRSRSLLSPDQSAGSKNAPSGLRMPSRRILGQLTSNPCQKPTTRVVSGWVMAPGPGHPAMAFTGVLVVGGNAEDPRRHPVRHTQAPLAHDLTIHEALLVFDHAGFAGFAEGARRSLRFKRRAGGDRTRASPGRPRVTLMVEARDGAHRTKRATAGRAVTPQGTSADPVTETLPPTMPLSRKHARRVMTQV